MKCKKRTIHYFYIFEGCRDLFKRQSVHKKHWYRKSTTKKRCKLGCRNLWLIFYSYGALALEKLSSFNVKRNGFCL